MTPVEKHRASSNVLVIQALTLAISTLLFSISIVLPVESVEIIYKQLQIDPEPECTPTTSSSQKFNFKYNHFCPNLIFRNKFDDDFLDNPIQQQLFVQIVKGENEHKRNQNKYNQQELMSGENVCKFFDTNIKLLAARITSLPWNFTATKQCRHVSNKFPENHYVPCEIRGESNISLSLRVDTQGLSAHFSENSSSYCVTGTNFLVAIFRKRKGAACLVKVQQYKIDLNMTKEKCEDYETLPTCGLYACSEEKKVLDKLEDLTGHTTTRPLMSTDEFSNNSESMKPYSEFWKTSSWDEMKKKSTIKDYFLELLAFLFLALLFIICLFNKCCRISETPEARHQPIVMVSESRRNSETGQFMTYRYGQINRRYPQLMEDHLGGTTKSKCSFKPACVCNNIGGRKKFKTKKWGHRGCDDESYTPVRQDDTATYIPSVARV